MVKVWVVYNGYKSPYSKPLGSLGKLNPCGICRFVEQSLFLTIRIIRFNSFKTILKQELMNTCLMYVIDYLIGSFNYDIRWESKIVFLLGFKSH
jgi:hypothetical protein